MKKLILFAAFAVVAQTAMAQEYAVPANYKLESAADYPRYEKDVVKAIDWLQHTPPGASDKKQKATAFIVQWISGSPDVTINVDAGLTNEVSANPEMSVIYLCGCLRYALLNPTAQGNHVKVNTAGVEQVIDYYQRNKDLLKHDPKIDALNKKYNNKTLESYVKGKMPK
ncbi:MAG: hypothetical protein EOO01_32205 [Chitinophagaceae bacterium]|nr:MAG: hypothetical protein EOO01_32205 [Chitinophagaceae bacterium]